MTPKEKGRFCSSCSKTVIDFTKMNTNEIQDFISQNRNKRICGHFKQTQLDSINLHIPSQVLEQRHNFHKLFLLVLLITMGTTLMNCTNKNGEPQKIDSIEIIDTLNHNKTIDVLEGLPVIEKLDSVSHIAITPPVKKQKKDVTEDIVIDGNIEIITTGDIATEDPSIDMDSLDIVKPTLCPPPEKENETDIEGEIVIGMLVAQDPPEFKDTPKHLSIQEKRDYLSEGVSKFVMANFQTSVCLKTGLKGKQRIYAKFDVDHLGNIQNIKTRAPHPVLEREALRVLKLLPQFIPAKQNGKSVNVTYTLPIVFLAE